MGKKKSKARQKRVNYIDIQIKFPNDGSESTLNFASKPTSPSHKIDFQKDDCLPILSDPEITCTLGTTEKIFPELPKLSNSMLELKSDDTESFITSYQEVASCDNLPLTSTLTPLPSLLEFKMLEVDALRIDRCCSFRLDCIVFKDSVPCLGNHLQDEMAKIVNSLHPKTAFSFRRKIHDLSHTIDHSISTYNSVCRNAAVRIDMLTAKESSLTEKVSRQWSQIQELENKIQKLTKLVSETDAEASDKFEKQRAELGQKDMFTTKEFLLTEKVTKQRSQIEELEKKIEKLTELVSGTNARTSDKFEMHRTELEEKDKIIRSLEEEVKIFKADKLKQQNSKLNEMDSTIISVEEAESLKAGGFRKLCSELEEENQTIQHLKEAASLEVPKLNTTKTTESQQNLEAEVLSTSFEDLTVGGKTESEPEISEFEKILELGKYLNKNLLSIQKAREIRSLQNKTNDLKMTNSDQKISRQEVLDELNSLKSQNASLKEQIHSKNRILDTVFPTLRNEILVKSTRIEELQKSIENVNDSLERSNSLILSLQEENEELKQNLTQLEIEISNSKISHCLPETTRLPRDRQSEREVEKINLHINDETQQALHETKVISSSHIATIEENSDKENVEFEPTFMKYVPVNVLMNPLDNPKRNVSVANSLQENIQILQHVIEIQQLSVQQQSINVRKLAEEIASIKLENSSLSERLKTNESKLSSLEVSLTSSRSSIAEYDAPTQKLDDVNRKINRHGSLQFKRKYPYPEK